MSIGIPKKIHQIWFQGEDQIPNHHKQKVASWKSLHPKFVYRCWDEYDIRKLLMNYYPWFVNQWDSYEHMHQKIDTGKYFILDNEGGFYVDMDVECVKSVSELAEKYNLIVTEYDMNCVKDGFCAPIAVATEFKLWNRPYCNNGIIASTPQHKFWKTLFQMLQTAGPSSGSKSILSKEISIMRTTGPSFFTLAVHHSGCLQDPTTLAAPPEWFEPCSIKQYLNNPIITPNTYAIHRFTLSWVDGSETWVNYLQYAKHHWFPIFMACVVVLALVLIYLLYVK